MSEETFFYPLNRRVAGFAILVLVAFGFGAATAMAAPQGAWQTPATDVSGIAGVAAAPKVATAPDGSVTVVWVQSEGGGEVVQAATREPGHPFAAPVNLSAPGVDAGVPQLAAGPHGAVTVVWQRGEGASQVIQSATRPPGGTFPAPEDLTAAGQAAHDPQVAVGPDGISTAVWIRGNVVQFATRPAGGAFGIAANLSADGEMVAAPRITIGDDGTAVVVWSRNDSVNDIVQAATRPPGGGFGPAADLTPTGQDATNSQIGVAPDGTATAIWRRTYGIAQHEIQVATQPPGGTFGSGTTLSVPGENGGDPLILVAPDGTATAVWYHVSEPTTFVRSATRPAGGSFSVPEDLTSNTAFAQFQQAAVGADGAVTVVWQIFEDLQWKVQARTRSPGGTFEAAKDLSAPGSGDFHPQVSIGPDGRATAVWVKNTIPGKTIQAISTEPASYKLDMARTGAGHGAVTSSPAGIDCGSDCSGNFDSLTKVILTASPDPGSTFTSWGGKCSGRSICEVTMTEAAAVTATFDIKCSRAKLKLKHLRKHRNQGTAHLTARIGLAGRVTLQGSKKVRRYSRKVGAGKVRLKIRPRGRFVKRLKRRGRLAVRVKVLYRPYAGCSTRTRTRNFTLIRRR